MNKDENLQHNVKRFLNYFRVKMERICLLQADESTRLYCKILYLIILDTLAKSVIQKKNENKSSNNLEPFYVREKIDPYSDYEFGSYFIKELND